MSQAVQLSDLSKVYSAARSGKRGQQKGADEEGVLAVDHIDLDIATGEFFTLLGPSGCGKTTTLRLIAGFEQPTSGEVRIQGEPMQHVAPNRRPVNTVFQNYALFPHLTVGENVAFGLNVKRVDKAERKQRVADALDLVRLPNVAERKPSQLSGGQQQRIALARAIVNRPVVLLLDEPLGALDLKLRKEMQMELKRMQQELGITLYLRHPRPGGGADDVRPHCGDAERRGAAGRRPGNALRAAGQPLCGGFYRRKQFFARRGGRGK